MAVGRTKSGSGSLRASDVRTPGSGRRLLRVTLPALLACAASSAIAQPYQDLTHDSKVFAEKRHYRIFLPRGYETSTRSYPVIFYFHGHSDRYTLEKYDDGKDTVPKIAAFTASHDVIVVAADGYVARDYTGFYGGAPYDVKRDGGQYDYGEYFLELLRHIDSSFRTLPGRRYHATSGLSMGGFASLYLSARYPDLIGSASAFNPGPEFYAGEPGRRSLWRPKDHTSSHGHTMVRLIRASGDYISQYHEETRAAYAAAQEVDFEFRQDEYHRHWATSIAETFEFHVRAFQNPKLEAPPKQWNYSSAQRRFDVYGYSVSSGIQGAGLTFLQHVSPGGFGLRTRRWSPDGPAAACASLTVLTAPLYHPRAQYQVADYKVESGTSTKTETRADAAGRVSIQLDCGAHEVSLTGPGAEPRPPSLLPLSELGPFRPMPGAPIHLPLRILNTRTAPLTNLAVSLTSSYPTVQILKGTAARKTVGAGAAADLSGELSVKFTSGAGDFTRTRLDLALSFDGGQAKESFDVMVPPDSLPAPAEVVILDGATRTFSVFRQTGNQGGGASIQRIVTEGAGNGNGRLEPGEAATLWVRLPQGLDPFDKNNWCRAKVYSSSPWLTEEDDIQEDKQREWTGAQNRTSLVRLSRRTPVEEKIPLILDCESWSFSFTPDVRFGAEPLYQAFQFHKHHLFGWNWATK